MNKHRFPSFGGLKAFYSVASAGSAVKAAANPGISASSISHQLKALEKELGVRLVALAEKLNFLPRQLVFLRFREAEQSPIILAYQKWSL